MGAGSSKNSACLNAGPVSICTSGGGDFDLCLNTPVSSHCVTVETMTVGPAPN